MKGYVILVIVLRTNIILSSNVVCIIPLDENIYVDQVYWVRPNMYKFVNLITSDNTRTINILAIYVHKAFKVRNTAIFAGNDTQ